MPNVIKYNISPQSLALRKGNFWIGTGDVSKGTTVNTDYWNGITPPAGGYTIYLNKATQGPAIFVAANDAALISITNRIASTNYSTVTDCLSWFATQTDKMVLNKDYESIITNGLVFNLDAGFIPSYPRSGTTWYDLGIGNNATAIGSPNFDSISKSFLFDATDDRFVSTISQPFDMYCLEVIFKPHKQISSNIAPDNNAYSLLGVRRSIGSNNGINVYEWTGAMTNETISFWSHDGYATGITDTVTNSFHMITFNWNGSTYDIWLDGVQKSTIQRANGHAQLLTSVTYIDPGYNAGYGYYHKGNISTVRAYNRSLTSQEILQNYYQGSIVTSNLILNLDAGNVISYPGSGNIWYDLSGNNNNFTLYNGVGYSTDNGGCLVFDGVNDYVSSSSNINLSSYDYVVVEVFYKCDSTTVAMLFEHTPNWNVNLGGFGLAINADGNNQLTNCNHTNHNTEVARNYLVSDNSSWSNNLNLYSKISDSTGRLTYVNGNLVSFTTTGGYPTGTGTSPNGSFPNAIFYIGSRGGSSSFFNGRISSIKIYGFKINSSQVQQNFNAYRSRFGI
jgi:hypothetical protein